MITSNSEATRATGPLRALLPFWIFLLLYEFGAMFQYTLMAPLSERVLPVASVGVIIGFSTFCQLVFEVPAGNWMDRRGYRTALKLAATLILASGVALLFGLSLTTYLLTLALSSCGWLFFSPGVSAYVLSHATKEASGRTMSLRDTFKAIGVVLGMGLLTLFVHWPVPAIGAIVIGLLAFAFVAISFAPRDRVSVLSEKKHPAQHYLIRRHRLRDAFRAIRRLNPASTMLLLQNLSSATFYGIVWFIVPLIIAETPGTSILGIGLSVFDLAIVVLGFALGWLADHVNKKRLVFAGLLLFAITGTVLGFQLSGWFIVLGFLATAGDEMSSVSLWAWLNTLDEHHEEDGEVSAAIMIFDDLGWSIGPAVAGFLYALIGPSWTIAAGAVPILLTWLISLWFFRHPAARHLEQARGFAKPHRARSRH